MGLKELGGENKEGVEMSGIITYREGVWEDNNWASLLYPNFDWQNQTN